MAHGIVLQQQKTDNGTWSECLLATCVLITFTDEKAEVLGSDLSEATCLDLEVPRRWFLTQVCPHSLCFQIGSYRPVQGDVEKLILI